MQLYCPLERNTYMPASPRIPSITQKQVAAFLSPRPRDSHKGKFGTAAVIGGAHGMVGASLLAGRAALKLGAGTVHVGILADHALSADVCQPELMIHSAQAVLQLPKMDVLAIGCGMGHDEPAQKILQDALHLNTTLVIDADALNILSRRPDLRTLLISRKAACVITPHPGESARLLGCTTDEVQATRSESAQELSKRFQSAVVLKGAQSLCVTRNCTIYVNRTGNPGMSSAGMGDVLTGMITALIAQGLNVDQAVLFAVHLHGAAGDAMAKQKLTIGMTASEVTEWARRLLNQWIKPHY